MTEEETDTYGDVPDVPNMNEHGHGNGLKALLVKIVVASVGLNVTVLIALLAWGKDQIKELRETIRQDVAAVRETLRQDVGAINNKLSDQRDQHYGLQVATQRSISELAIQTARAAGEAARAVDRSMLAERESRLAQEDLTLLRAKVAAAGIEVESSGDHQ